MKNKLLELAAFVFMFCTVLIPNQVFSVYFQYASEPLSETSYLCRYLLTTIAWLIFLYYIVKRLLFFISKTPESGIEPADID